MSIGLMLSAANPGLLAFNLSSSRSNSDSYDDDHRRRMRVQRDADDHNRRMRERRYAEDERYPPYTLDAEEDAEYPRANQYRPPQARTGRKPASSDMALLMAERRAEAARIAALPPYGWRWSITEAERAVQTDLWHRYTVPLQEAARVAAEAEQARIKVLHAEAAVRARRAEEDKAAGRRLLFVIAVAGVLALVVIIAFGIRGA